MRTGVHARKRHEVSIAGKSLTGIQKLWTMPLVYVYDCRHQLHACLVSLIAKRF